MATLPPVLRRYVALLKARYPRWTWQAFVEDARQGKTVLTLWRSSEEADARGHLGPAITRANQQLARAVGAVAASRYQIALDAGVLHLACDPALIELR